MKISERKSMVHICENWDIYGDGRTELTLVFRCEYGNQKDKSGILLMVDASYDPVSNEGESMKLRLDDALDYIA